MKDYHFENDDKEFDTTIRLDHIIEKVKENYELKNVSKKYYSNNNEYLELVRELKDDLQKEFENIYVAKVRDNKNISIDYKCLNKF